MVTIKSASDIEKMREAGKIAANALQVVGQKIRPGMTTKEIDKIIHREITAHGAKPSFLGYGGFPASACVSVNNEVIHGIPSHQRRIAEGDIVSVDVGAFYKGFHSDTCYTFAVGEISPEAKALLQTTEESLYEAIKAAVVGARLGDISHTVESYCRDRGYGIVKQFCGHGIGRNLHEDPEVPNYGAPGRGQRLRPGMTIAIEPMVNIGAEEVYEMPDGWTVKTRDGSLSAHYENTLALTSEGVIITTLLDKDW